MSKNYNTHRMIKGKIANSLYALAFIDYGIEDRLRLNKNVQFQSINNHT